MLAIRRVLLWACMRVERSYVAEEEIGIATILHHVEARQTPNGVRTIYAYFDLEVSLAVKHGTQLFDECSHRQLERWLRGYVIKESVDPPGAVAGANQFGVFTSDSFARTR